MRIHRYLLRLLFVAFVFATSCRSMYYATWEKLGKQKRHLLRDNVEAAKGEQQEASEQFKDALARLRELYRVRGGELETAYDKLQSDYEDCEARAEDVTRRITKVNEVAQDLFVEWEAEIKQISSSELQRKSRRKLASTRERFADLLQAMRQSESRMNKVLVKLRDQVLYLKHNLNAQAVGSLRNEADKIQTEIAYLIKDMNKSIQEADKFVQGL